LAAIYRFQLIANSIIPLLILIHQGTHILLSILCAQCGSKATGSPEEKAAIGPRIANSMRDNPERFGATKVSYAILKKG